MNIMDILYVPMGYLMRFASFLTHNNYLLAIMLFALIMEIILSPIQIKQQKTQIKQAKLQPMINVITRKYEGRKDNASMQKKQQEVMELYQKEGFNPAGGCLPMLIQLPIIWCLYKVIITPLRYICGLSEGAVSEIMTRFKDMGVEGFNNQQSFVISYFNSNPDKLAQFNDIEGVEGMTLPNYNFFGLDLSQMPSLNDFGWLWLVPLAVFLAMFGSMIITKKFTYQTQEAMDAQNAVSMKIMNFSMPLLSAFISFSVPIAVAFYWVFRNILSVVERFIISKIYPIPRLTPEEMKAAEREYLGKKPKKAQKDPDRPAIRSLHRIDFDDEPLPPPTPDRFDREEEKERAEKTSVEESRADSDSTQVPIDKAPLKNDDKKNVKKKKK